MTPIFAIASRKARSANAGAAATIAAIILFAAALLLSTPLAWAGTRPVEEMPIADWLPAVLLFVFGLALTVFALAMPLLEPDPHAEEWGDASTLGRSLHEGE